MKRLFFILFLISPFFVASSQLVDFNQYKYIVVDSKFDFVRETDGYRTSTYLKSLFRSKGFVVFLDNEEFPADLAEDGCRALYADVKDDSGFLTTRSYIEITNCSGKLLFKSSEGKSREKEYARAYRESIREAFEPIIKIPYKYDSSLVTKVPVANTKKEVSEEVIPEVKEPKEEKKPVRVVQEVAVQNKIVVKKAPAKVVEKEDANSSLETLYAQPKGKGYQLVDTKPAVVFVLLKTNDPKKFFIEGKNGTFTQKDGYWLAEFYENGELVTKKYIVKF